MRAATRLIAGAAVAMMFAAPAAHAGNGPDPSGPAKYGLCRAYFSGSDTGREHKRHAPPFQNLEAAAEASDQSVAEYCAAATPGGK